MYMIWNHTLTGAGMPGANTTRYARLQLLAEKEKKEAHVVAASDEFTDTSWGPVEDSGAPLPATRDPRCKSDRHGRKGWPPSPYRFLHDPAAEPLHYAF